MLKRLRRCNVTIVFLFLQGKCPNVESLNILEEIEKGIFFSGQLVVLLQKTGIRSKCDFMTKEKWEGQNYLVKHSSKIQLNSHGYLILDSLMDELFRLKLA